MNRAFRLLPAVVVLGAGLLALKGVDIARAAQSAAITDQDEPDNSGLAPGHINGGLPGKDFAGEDAAAGSAATVDVMGSLTRRRAELDARERALAMRENVLKAGEGRVDQKISDIKALQAQMQSLLNQRDAKQDAQIASLVKTYSAMKAKDAARIFDSLADNVLLPVAKGMKSDVLAPVLAAMNSDAAQKLTEKLAALLKLPESSSTICPATTADAAAPVNVAAAPTPADPIPAALLAPPPIAATVAPNITPASTTPGPTPVTSGPPVDAAPVVPKPHKAVEHHPAPAKPLATTVAKPVATATTAAKPVMSPALPTPSKPEPAPAPPVKATITPPVAAAATTTPAAAPIATPAPATIVTPAKPAAPQIPASAAPTPITPAKSN